ncbi:MAG: protein-glutamate O-methyltransferase [Paracoccaceae bacterium]|nr:protein-glutamate O-methyltransferase [Paracoccaceae bacterium]
MLGQVTPQTEIEFDDADFQALARLARAEFGLNLAESKKPLVYSRLSRRLKARGTPSFKAYLNLLSQSDEAGERTELISALTTNVTSFFRENHHFDMLKERLLPELVSTARAGGRVRIWSSACSSGQEAYCIAMTVLEALPEAASLDVRILATDIDQVIVARARDGIYPDTELETLPGSMQKRFFEPAQHGGDMQASDDLKRLITFAELNLVAPWPFKGPFDAIFCRNVAIYFDQATQERLWARLGEVLRPSGYLFIGHSERLTGVASAQFETAGVTAYQKRAQAA